MFKQSIIATSVAALLIFSSNSFACPAPCNNGIYVQALGGIAMGNANGLNSQEAGANQVSISSGVDTTDNSALFGAAVGYAIPNLPLRVELQGLHLNEQSYKLSTLYPLLDNYHEFDDIDVHSNILLANAYYTIPICGFKPFVGGGIGGARNTVSGSFNSDTQVGYAGGWKDQSETKFAYNLSAGVGYQFTSHLSASLAYQYLSLGKVNTVTGYYSNNGTTGAQSLSADKLSFNNILLGVAYTF